MQAQRTTGEPVFLVLVFVIVAVTSMGIFINQATMFTKHAKTSHDYAIPEIDKCFNGNGTIGPSFMMDNGRYAQYCFNGGKNNFWRIFECKGGDRLVITQFKQNVRRLANYIKNHKMEVTEPSC